jgi:hypothetical protein
MEAPVLYLTSSYVVHMLVHRPHDNGSRVVAFDVQYRRLRRRKLSKDERRAKLAESMRSEAAAVGSGVKSGGKSGDSDDDGNDSDSNVLGPPQDKVQTDAWKKDAWCDIGRFVRRESTRPPVANLQYQFPVPLPADTPAWAVSTVPDHVSPEVTEAAMWHGHPAIGDHLGRTGHVAAPDPRVSYLACVGILPRSVNQFRVRAVNAVGPGEWSEPSIAVKTTRTAPLPPGQVRLKGQADNLLSVYWAPARPNGYPVTRYHLECREVIVVDPTYIGPLPTAAEDEKRWFTVRDDLIETYCLVAGLKYGVGYTFRVKALNKVGWSLWSATSDVIKTSRLLT